MASHLRVHVDCLTFTGPTAGGPSYAGSLAKQALVGTSISTASHSLTVVGADGCLSPSSRVLKEEVSALRARVSALEATISDVRLLSSKVRSAAELADRIIIEEFDGRWKEILRGDDPSWRPACVDALLKKLRKKGGAAASLIQDISKAMEALGLSEDARSATADIRWMASVAIHETHVYASPDEVKSDIATAFSASPRVAE